MKILSAPSETTQPISILNFIEESIFYKNELLSGQFLEKGNLVVCEKDISLKDLKIFLKKLNKNNYQLTVILAPNKFKENDLGFRKILYPLSINDFEKILHNEIVSANVSFKDITLSSDNMITNLTNDKSVFLTETEKEILKLLIKEKKVKKEKLKYEILNFQPNIDTKSLESHLSRLRKKLNDINSFISILPLTNNSVQIF